MTKSPLYKLLNKNGYTESQFLDYDPSFDVNPMSSAWLEVQRRLFLDVAESKTPFFIRRAMSILASFPDITEFLDVEVPNYAIFGSLVKDNQDFFVRTAQRGRERKGYTPICSNFPIGINYKLEFLEGFNLKVTNEYETYVITDVTTVQDNRKITISAKWPEKFPILGDLAIIKSHPAKVMFYNEGDVDENGNLIYQFVDGGALGATYNYSSLINEMEVDTIHVAGQSLITEAMLVGQVFEFKYEPQHIDYAAWESYLTETQDYDQILKDSGLLTVFFLASKPIEKIALILAALYKSYEINVN